MTGHRFDFPTIGFGQPIREIVVTAGFAVIVLALCVAVSMLFAVTRPVHRAVDHGNVPARTTLVHSAVAHRSAQPEVLPAVHRVSVRR